MSRDARLRRFQAQALADGAGGQRCPRCRATMIRPELYEIPHRAGWGLVEDPETGELEVVCLACRQEAEHRSPGHDLAGRLARIHLSRVLAEREPLIPDPLRGLAEQFEQRRLWAVTQDPRVVAARLAASVLERARSILARDTARSNVPRREHD